MINLKNHFVCYFIRSFFIILICLVGCVAAFSLTSKKASADSYRYRVKTTDILSVRTRPQISSPRAGLLKKGQIVVADKICSKEWYRIKYNGRLRYISKKYTKSLDSLVKYSKKKLAKARCAVNVRAASSVGSKKFGCLGSGQKIYVAGYYKTVKKAKWYYFTYKKKKAYVLGKYITLIKKTQSEQAAATKPAVNTSNNNSFEKSLTDQGFPESYKVYLRKLHSEHPKWRFIAQKTGCSWSVLNSKANKVGVNLIDYTVTKKWRSKAKTVYKNGKWTTFDGGRWYQAKPSVIAYYLDPRTSLNEQSVYQFMYQGYDANSQNKSTVKSLASVVSYSFLNTTSYINTINSAGKDSGVNPNVLAAMIIEEQGWLGKSKLISGNYPGYKGFYNFFNIGAYTTDMMSATERGLWYAKGAGKKTNTYGRPWNSKYKAIKGGALFYREMYMDRKQNTYYTKKFNVMNGAANIGEHEYMTNVMGAREEGSIAAYAYRNNSDYPILFYIPVYTNMPAQVCVRPAE